MVKLLISSLPFSVLFNFFKSPFSLVLASHPGTIFFDLTNFSCRRGGRGSEVEKDFIFFVGESKMSCNGCRVLRKGCGETCVLRSCLLWIDSPDAQGNATLFLAKFFGRSDLLSFISAVPDHQRPALFKSLLFEACGRTVNPVNGAVGLLTTGNWHVCQAAVETVLSGGVPRQIQGLAAGHPTLNNEDSLLTSHTGTCTELIPSPLLNPPSPSIAKAREYQPSDFGNLCQTKLIGKLTGSTSHGGCKDRKLLNLFV